MDGEYVEVKKNPQKTGRRVEGGRWGWVGRGRGGLQTLGFLEHIGSKKIKRVI